MTQQYSKAKTLAQGLVELQKRSREANIEEDTQQILEGYKKHPEYKRYKESVDEHIKLTEEIAKLEQELAAAKTNMEALETSMSNIANKITGIKVNDTYTYYIRPILYKKLEEEAQKQARIEADKVQLMDYKEILARLIANPELLQIVDLDLLLIKLYERDEFTVFETEADYHEED